MFSSPKPIEKFIKLKYPSSEQKSSDILSALGLRSPNEAIKQLLARPLRDNKGKVIDLAHAAKLVAPEIMANLQSGQWQDQEGQRLWGIVKGLQAKTPIALSFEQARALLAAKVALNKYCHQPATFERFIKERFGKSDWSPFIHKGMVDEYPTSSIDLLAEIVRKEIFVWDTEFIGGKQLELQHRYFKPGKVDGVIHLLRQGVSFFLPLDVDLSAEVIRDDSSHQLKRVGSRSKFIANTGIDIEDNDKLLQLYRSNSTYGVMRPGTDEAAKKRSEKNKHGKRTHAPKGMNVHGKSDCNSLIPKNAKRSKAAFASYASEVDRIKKLAQLQAENAEALRIGEVSIQAANKDIATALREIKSLSSPPQKNDKEKKIIALEAKIQRDNDKQYSVEQKVIIGENVVFGFNDKNGDPICAGNQPIYAIQKDNHWYKCNVVTQEVEDKIYMPPADATQEEYVVMGCQEWEYNNHDCVVESRQLCLTGDNDKLFEATAREYPMLINHEGISIGGQIYVMSAMPTDFTGYQNCYIFIKSPARLVHIQESKEVPLNLDDASFDVLAAGLENADIVSEFIPLQAVFPEDSSTLAKFWALIANNNPAHQTKVAGKKYLTQDEYKDLVLQDKKQEAARFIAEHLIQFCKEKRNKFKTSNLGYVDALGMALTICQKLETQRSICHGSEDNNRWAQPFGPGMMRIISPELQSADLTGAVVSRPITPRESKAEAIEGEMATIDYMNKLDAKGYECAPNPEWGWQRDKTGKLYKPSYQFDYKALHDNILKLKGKLADLEQEPDEVLADLSEAITDDENKPLLAGDQKVDPIEKVSNATKLFAEMQAAASTASLDADEIQKVTRQLKAAEMFLEQKFALDGLELAPQFVFVEDRNMCLFRRNFIGENQQESHSDYYVDDTEDPIEQAFWELERNHFRPDVMQLIREIAVDWQTRLEIPRCEEELRRKVDAYSELTYSDQQSPAIAQPLLNYENTKLAAQRAARAKPKQENQDQLSAQSEPQASEVSSVSNVVTSPLTSPTTQPKRVIFKAVLVIDPASGLSQVAEEGGESVHLLSPGGHSSSQPASRQGSRRGSVNVELSGNPNALTSHIGTSGGANRRPPATNTAASTATPPSAPTHSSKCCVLL